MGLGRYRGSFGQVMAETELIIGTGGVDDGVRECPVCRVRKPLTEQFFNKDFYGPQGFRAMCKDCRNQERKKEKEKKDKKRVEAAIELTKKHVVLNNVSTKASGAELAAAVLEMFGGVTGFITSLHEDYLMSAPGTPVRHKNMALMVQIVSNAAKDLPAEDPSKLTDDELRERIRFIAHQVEVSDAR